MNQRPDTEKWIALKLTTIGVLLLALFILTKLAGENYCCDGPCWNPAEDSR